MYPGITGLMSGSYFGDFDMSRFNFIGFYENCEADIPRLARDLGLPLVDAALARAPHNEGAGW
jgi:hypothetical protein